MEKVKQISPVMASEGMFPVANEDGSRNDRYQIIAIALMESGRILPVIWDSFHEPLVYDPVTEEVVETIINKVRR